FPDGCWIRNETFTGFPAGTGAVGVKSASLNVRAARIVGVLGPDDEQPVSARTKKTRPRAPLRCNLAIGSRIKTVPLRLAAASLAMPPGGRAGCAGAAV